MGPRQVARTWWRVVVALAASFVQRFHGPSHIEHPAFNATARTVLKGDDAPSRVSRLRGLSFGWLEQGWHHA
jgi:hypothetical protein